VTLYGVDLVVILASFGAVTAGALVKGVTGVGLPMVAIPLMVQVLPVPTVISLLSVPILSSNIFQLNDRREMAHAVTRFWSLLLVMVAAVVIGAWLLVTADPKLVGALVGIIVIAFALFSIAKPEIRIPPRLEPVASPLTGLVAGVLGGISGLYAPPLVLYLVNLKLPKDSFVVTISLFYLVGQTPLYVILANSSLFGWREFVASAALAIPAYVGVWLGQRVRGRIDQLLFTRLVLAVQIVSGALLVWKVLA
jgi:hypothetical protein